MPRSLLPPIPPYTKQRLPTERVTVPLIFPVLGAQRWRASYNEDWGSHRHTGCDLPAPRLAPVVAPLSGTLGFKVQTFWIVGDNGWGCLGTHLNDDTPGTRDNKGDFDFMFAPNLFPGMQVQAGQLIGYVGDSGDANGPHLHFELHGPDGLRDPAPSLRAARRIASPLSTLPQIAPPLSGQSRTDGCLRGFAPQTRRLTLVLLVKPKRLTFTLTDSVLQSLGGTAGIVALSRSQVLSLYHRQQSVERIVLSPMPSSTTFTEASQPLLRLSGSGLSGDSLLTRCAAAELAQFAKLSSPRWIRTGSMALGPLRMRGTKLKQAVILCLSGSTSDLFAHDIVQEALRYDGFTRFGGAVGKGRIVLILADG